MFWIPSAILCFILIATLVKNYDAKLRYAEWTSKLPNEISIDDDSYIKQKGQQLTFAFPGTKWCGPGNTASSYEDLGIERETDKCCRAHDNCDNIPAGETKNNLTNNGMFTRD
ncbi:uncharacterized protein LOC113389464 [Ctenocephalides felis]|uniref:uncharacterized protein LOC113389464 n=1 Tax=Ctenocephalides felis TaxID=7515 RepID=UPI000E6E26B4|nr:uncharacterized protein LOC113389464 [Ctenocephalides felis]